MAVGNDSEERKTREIKENHGEKRIFSPEIWWAVHAGGPDECSCRDGGGA